MAYTFESNSGVAPTTGAVAVYLLKTTLKAAGWTVPSSSDGTTYNASGDQITTGASGAGGMANTSAWFRIKEPGTNGRELLFQRGTTNLLWRILYSGGPSTGFVGGSPAATQTPSATDEQGITGGGTHASPTYTTWLGTDGAYKIRAVVGGATELYSFCFFTHLPASFQPVATISLDVLATGTFNALDQDPALVGWSATTGFGTWLRTGGSASSGSEGNKGWFKKNLGSAAFSFFGWATLSFAGTTYAPAGTSATGGLNPYSGKDDVIPLIFGKAVAPAGWKGVSTLFRGASYPRALGDTYTVSTTKDYLCVAVSTECHLIPWDGTDFTP